MSDTTSPTILSKLQAHFAQYDLPDKIISDNGPQLTSKDFKDFYTRYQVVHETLSPGNNKANGAAVKIANKYLYCRRIKVLSSHTFSAFEIS